MECNVSIKNVIYTFKLFRNTDGIIVLQCNGWNLIEITENGLHRCRSVRLNAPFVDTATGVVKWRTNHHHMMEQQSSKGKRDVQLRLNPNNEEIYINAITDENETHICYIDREGLYLWIDDRHEYNSYPMSKDRTILVIE